MSCDRHLLNFHWQHHSWRPRVTFAEVLTSPDTNMWARTVYREYTRCDKEEVCAECGAVRHQRSCICDPAEGDSCKLRQEWIRSAVTSAPPSP